MRIIDSRNAFGTWLCCHFESHPQLHFSTLGIGHLRKGVQSEQVAEEIRTRADGTVCKCAHICFIVLLVVMFGYHFLSTVSKVKCIYMQIPL